MLISGLCKLQLVLNFSYLASSYIPVQSVLCIYVYISQHICCRGRRIGWCNLPTPARGDDVCSYDDSRWCLFDSPQVSDDCRGERANWCPWVWVQRHAGKSVTFHLFCSLHFMCHEHTYTHNHVNYHTHTHTNTRAHIPLWRSFEGEAWLFIFRCSFSSSFSLPFSLSLPPFHFFLYVWDRPSRPKNSVGEFERRNLLWVFFSFFLYIFFFFFFSFFFLFKNSSRSHV